LIEYKIEEVLEQIKVLVCEITEHDYGFDQCGFWQHKYCYKCGKSKYPLLVTKSCSELREEMGSITEEEYKP